MNRRISEILLITLAVVATNALAADAIRGRVAAADKAYETGDYVTALNQFAEIRLAATNDSQVLLHSTARIAECQYSLGRYDDALRSYEELLTKWPHGSRRYFPDLHFGDCLVMAGRTNAAIRAYNLVNKDYPTNFHVNIESRIEEMRKKSPNKTSEAIGAPGAPQPQR